MLVNQVNRCVLLCFLSLILLACEKVDNDLYNTKIQQFWETGNTEPIMLSESLPPTLVLFDSSTLEKNQVFLAGENHGIANNYDLYLNLFQFFHTKAGTRYLLLEASYSAAELLNEYIQTGETAILDFVFQQWKGTSTHNLESYQFWKKLYAWNQTLPANQRIRPIGIDIEFQSTTALEYLKRIFPSGKPAPEIQPVITALQSVSFLTEAELTSFRQSLVQYPGAHQQFWGNYHFSVDIVTYNLLKIQALRKEKESIFIQQRESLIYENFMKVTRHLPKGKYFGQWGHYHILQKSVNNTDRLAGKMQYDTNSPVKNQVLSIQYFYKDSKARGKDGSTFDEKQSYTDDGKIMESFAFKEYTLFRLIGKDAPFEENLIWWNIYEKQPNIGVTTESLQYYLLIKNGKKANNL